MIRGKAWLALAALTIGGFGSAPAEAQPFKYAYKSKYAEFDFSWPSEAAAIPALARRLHADLAKEKARTIGGGKEEYDMRREMGSEALIGWSSSTKFKTGGQSIRLLSLSREYWTFTGGAHGNGATTALLWDRRLGKEVAFPTLFPAGSTYAQVLRGPYCRALDEERKKRRGGYGKLGGGGSASAFDSCPKFSDLASIPADRNGNGRFDRIRIIAAPYTAGPFAEGSYDIALPVTARLIALLKPEYRGSFEAQRQ
jgi:hypothetical protein